MSRPVTLTSGPWKGVNDSITAAEQSEEFAQNAFNVYAKDGILLGRPGLRITPVVGATQLGTGGGRRGQCVHSHTSSDGTIYRFLVCGGKLYRWTGQDGVAPVDVTPVGVTITAASGSRVYMSSFGDSVLVNDETNRPWIMTTLGGTPVTGTYINVDGAGSAWVARGRPIIYSAKAFFILLSVAAGASAGTYGNTVVWSEEASPSTGYLQIGAGFTNFWQLTQTSNDQIYAIHGTEGALYYFREAAIGAVYGKVNSDFVAAATQDTVSLTVGTKYPATVVQTDNYIWFADRFGRPHRMPIGGPPQPIWNAMAQAYRDETMPGGGDGPFVSLSVCAQACYDPDLGLVRFALWNPSDLNAAQRMYCFAADTGNYVGLHAVGAGVPTLAAPSLAGIFIDAMGVLPTDQGWPRFCVLGTSGTTYNTANQGWFWTARRLNEELWHDVDGGGAPLATSVGAATHLVLDTADVEFMADRSTLECLTPGPANRAVTMTYLTPRATGGPLTGTVLVGGDQTSLGHGRVTFGHGPNCIGRWLRYLTLTDTSVQSFSSSQFALERFTVRGTAVQLNPSAA